VSPQVAAPRRAEEKTALLIAVAGHQEFSIFDDDRLRGCADRFHEIPPAGLEHLFHLAEYKELLEARQQLSMLPQP
jgi:hypothetical protein